MTARQVCLGWHWYPYAYARTATDGDGTPVKPFPTWLDDLAQRAVTDALGAPTASYDIALINFYDGAARMGMHRDADERSDAPVVSLSLGDTCVFRFGNPETRTKPYTDVELRSGDLFVFGGRREGRFTACRGSTRARRQRSWGCGGRLNVTLRVSGF